MQGNVKEIKILILVKSIDGGTGTLVEGLLNLRKGSVDGKPFIIKTSVLEKPKFRDIRGKNYSFFHPKNYYPQHYSLSFVNLVSFVKETAWFMRELKKFHPDIVMSIDVHCNFISTFIKMFSLFSPFKLIITTQIYVQGTIGEKSRGVLSVLISRAIRFLYMHADVHTCPSSKLRESLIDDFNLHNIITIPNGIKLRKVTAPKKFRDGEKIILSIARFVEQKDHETLIRAFQLILRKFPDAQLWLISDGFLREYLESLAKNCGVLDHIHFLGWVDNINLYLRKADIFVLSSKREGFAYVLIEAMAYCLPIVSTDTLFGPSEILGGGKHGILVPVGNVQALSIALIKLLTDKDEYSKYSSLAYERSKYYSQGKMIDQYRRVITKVLHF